MTNEAPAWPVVVLELSASAPVPPSGDCRVYWGSHGCRLARGHEGDCECDCCECEHHPDPDPDNPGGESSCVAKSPYYGPRTRFYGEDVIARGLPQIGG